jgi:CAAX prenyl protease-like protein
MQTQTKTSAAPWLRDDVAYILPMAVFMVFTAVGGQWPSLFVFSYIAKTILVAGMLPFLWRYYTKISWKFWWLGIIAGILGVVQWVGMEKGIVHFWPNYPPYGHREAFDPFAAIASPSLRVVFLIVRLLGPVLVVPFMEERFWRDFLWRTLLAPNDFKLAAIGEWEAWPFWIVVIFFASVHIQWMTAIIWGIGIGFLLVKTRSLGACIVMHAVTNLLLGVYVLVWHDWAFW